MLPEPTPIDQTPNEAERIIEAVLLLHAMFYPVKVIAQRLHLSASDVEHVIKTGTLPQNKLEPAWQQPFPPTGGDSNG